MSQAETPVIFIHGIKGGTLVSPKGQTRWLTTGEALGFTTYDLRLPLSWENEKTQTRDGLRPGLTLRRIRVIPGLIEEQIYGPWLEANEKRSPTQFSAFAYDWRRDNIENAEAFEAYIDTVRAKNKNAQVDVVAHSMGGLITLAVLLRSPPEIS